MQEHIVIKLLVIAEVILNFFCAYVNGTPVAGKSFANIVVTRLKMSKNR